MKKRNLFISSALALAVVSASALAAQNVANTSQKGSLLIFPRIDVSDGKATVVRISNDYEGPVSIKCYWKNGTKFFNDFLFEMSSHQPVWFDAASGQGTININPFPTAEGPFAKDEDQATQEGELKCWASDRAGHNQIVWNHLSGTATVYDFNDGTAYEYNSWNFIARTDAEQGQPVGEPGQILLDGGKNYDACPAYLVGHFTPAGTAVQFNGVVSFDQNLLTLASCKQDLRQDHGLTYTKAKFDVWNAQEVKFTGAYACMNSWEDISLGDDVDVNGGNFAVGTGAASFRVQGVASDQCDFETEATGLVGVLSHKFTVTDFALEAESSAATAVNLNTAGFRDDGFILYDPQTETQTR
jgi:hypothetical protein